MAAIEAWGKVKKAAQYAGVSERTFRDFLKMGLDHVRLPSGTILIHKNAIDEFYGRYIGFGNQS